MVYKGLTYANGARIVSLNSGSDISLRIYGATNRIAFLAGATLTYSYDNAFLGQYNLAVVCANSTSSWLHVNKSPYASGDAGTRTPNKLFVASDLAGGNNGHVEVACIILRSGEDNSTFEDNIFSIINQRYLHTPYVTDVYDADPRKVIVSFEEALDPATDDITPADFIVQLHTVTAVAVDDGDNTKLNLTLSTDVTVGQDLYVAFSSSSAGGLLTADGEPVPQFKLPLTNHTT